MIGNKKIWTTTNRNIKVRTVSTKLNKLLWLAASVTSIVTVIISMYFPIFKESSSLMLALIIIGISIMLTIVRFTNQGIRSWYFLCDARLEMRKIVWPTRQETVNLAIGLAITNEPDHVMQPLHITLKALLHDLYERISV